jgi:hypothetical protein
METQARLAIQALLKANESSLFSGIVAHGVQRSWQHVTTSALTPPTGYYYASVVAEEAPLKESSLGKNSIVSLVNGEYQISVVIIDYIEGVTGETELYETMDAHFQIVTDRVKKLVFDTATFTNGGYQFKLVVPKEVDKRNTPVSWQTAEAYYAVLVTQISFRLVECILS